MKNISIINDEIVENYARKLKTCGHPVRLRILSIIKNGKVCVKELGEYIDQPQPIISQHLAVLKENDILGSEADGNRRIYYIEDPFIKQVIPLIKTYHRRRR